MTYSLRDVLVGVEFNLRSEFTILVRLAEGESSGAESLDISRRIFVAGYLDPIVRAYGIHMDGDVNYILTTPGACSNYFFTFFGSPHGNCAGHFRKMEGNMEIGPCSTRMPSVCQHGALWSLRAITTVLENPFDHAGYRTMSNSFTVPILHIHPHACTPNNTGVSRCHIVSIIGWSSSKLSDYYLHSV
jgi:hypothetical protein